MYYQNITRVPWFESMIDYQYSANRIRQHLVTAGIAVTGAGAVLLMLLYPIIPPELPPPPRLPEAFTAPGLFFYTFNNDGTLYETSKEEWSSSPYWWLTSGGKLVIEEFVGKTNHGDLPITDPWRVLYAASNPLDTDNGRHPQNICRLATKRTGTDVRVETLFKIERDNFSDSSNRNATNGLLLMSRYVDYNNLYYAGVRVDGAAVIKKKYNGRYYTLAYEKIFPGTYRREDNVNFIPHRQWLGLRVENVEQANGSVAIRLYMKRYWEPSWTLILEAIDDGTKTGGAPIVGEGRAGLRTDFMDVTFESFRMEDL